MSKEERWNTFVPVEESDETAESSTPISHESWFVVEHQAFMTTRRFMKGPSRMDNDTPGIEVDLIQRSPSPSAFVGINRTCIVTSGTIKVKSIAVQ